MFKYLAIIALVCACISAEYLYGDNPYNYVSEYASAYDNYKPKDYKFEYGVSDPHTGDHKSQWEVQENGIVRGAYSLLEADGTTRVVEYYADDTGFHANVKNIGTPIHHSPTHAPLYSAHGGSYGYGDIAQFTGYGTSGVAVNNYALPQQKIVVEQPEIYHHEQPQLPKVLYHEQPKVLTQEQPYSQELPIGLYHQQPLAHAQAFAKVLLEKQLPIPVQYANQQAYTKVLLDDKQLPIPVQYANQVPQHYNIPQPVKYIPDQISYAMPQAQQIKYELPQQKNVVIYENAAPHPQQYVVNYGAAHQELPQYYEKQLSYGYEDAAAPQYYHASY